MGVTQAGFCVTYDVMAIAEYGALDGLGLAELVRKREVTPAELLEEAIARAQRVNPRINAIVTPLHDEARRAAAAPLPEGRFTGLPFLLKDLEAPLAGTPMSFGSRFVQGYIPSASSTLVERFLRAGVVVFGKTNTPEFGLTPYTEPELFGPTRNPWDVARTSGGSSGGAAAAVAAGIVPVAHASDGGGSIRIPASCCGLFGLKPTRGRTPAGPDISEHWSGFSIDHVVSRSVRDSAAMLDAIAGPEPTAPYWAPPPARPFLDEVGAPPGKLRIALSKRPMLMSPRLDPDCAAATDDAARLLADLGHTVEEADPDVDADLFGRDFFTIVCVEMANLLERMVALTGRRPRRGEIQTSTALTAMLGRQRSALEAWRAFDRLQAASRAVARFFERFDLLLSPTLGFPPFTVGALHPRGAEAVVQDMVVALRLGFLLRLPGVVEASARRVFAFIPYTPVANVTGQPAITVPLYWNAAGLPIGSMLTARFGDEATLFRVGAQLEAARPWQARRPPVHADA
jgi:amidase